MRSAKLNFGEACQLTWTLDRVTVTGLMPVEIAWMTLITSRHMFWLVHHSHIFCIFHFDSQASSRFSFIPLIKECDVTVM